MEKKKAYEQPKAGIFYLIPDPKKEGSYTFHSQIQEDPGQDVSHLFLFDKLKPILEKRFKVVLDDAYTGIPRGRILEPSSIQGDWIVAHGGNFPLNEFKEDIIQDFTLRDASELGKVKFEIDSHEKMGALDKREIEITLGIEYTPEGWKKKKHKTR
jgi:hypothetical protein